MKRTGFFGFDIVLLCSTLVLVVIGVLFIYSSGVTATGVSFSDEYIKQIVWLVTGLVLLAIILFIDYSYLMNLSLYIYGFFILLLVFTLFFGKVVNGARSWLGFAEAGVQPSEFMKLATILFLAFYYVTVGNSIVKLRYFLVGLAITLLPVFLIVLQPDVGTALVFFPIFIVMSVAAGARIRHLVFFIATFFSFTLLVVLPFIEEYILGEEYPIFSFLRSPEILLIFILFLLLIIGIAVFGYFKFKRKVFYWIIFTCLILILALFGTLLLGSDIQSYQIKRIVSFFNPYDDYWDSGWHTIQSMTAIGSGGFIGKGYLQGTQSHYQYLPQQSTDFIFSLIAEEWGFLGGSLVIALFLLLLVRGINIISGTSDKFAVLTGVGIIGMIYFHVVINIGMSMGIMPITGIPLLFLSYGGSSLWTALIGIGILLNISFRRYR
ncbi:MAG: rod shape-determining protein RodA [Spirochaetales bacterium]|nr:rod shape-determining protein RodA [Spirochaetales bacterium]